MKAVVSNSSFPCNIELLCFIYRVTLSQSLSVEIAVLKMRNFPEYTEETNWCAAKTFNLNYFQIISADLLVFSRTVISGIYIVIWAQKK